MDDFFMECIDGSHVRSLFCFGNEISSSFDSGIPKKYRLLKVIHFEGLLTRNVLNNIENFLHLKYLSFTDSHIEVKVPKSISMLQNLETLVIKSTKILKLPKEISKLQKLKYLRGNLSLIQLKDGIGEMKSLQTLRYVWLEMDGEAEVIKALGKLKLIRELGLNGVSIENGSILSSSISEMQHLETLYITLPFNDHESIDLNWISPPAKLKKLTLLGELKKFPEWMLDLQNLTVLWLEWPYSVKDPLQSLERLQHLLRLFLYLNKYESSHLHFQDGGFQKLNKLNVENSSTVREIIFDKGSMPSLKTLHLSDLRNLKNIPTGIQHLEKLEDLWILGVDDEFGVRSSTEDWNWIMEHVSLVNFYSRNWREIKNSRS